MQAGVSSSFSFVRVVRPRFGLIEGNGESARIPTLTSTRYAPRRRSRYMAGLENQRDSCIQPLSVDPADVNFSNHARRIDEDRRRLRHNSVRSPHSAALIECNREGHGERPDEPLDVLGATLLIEAVDRNNLQAAFCVFRVHSDQLGKLGSTWCAPCTPERNDDRLTAKLRELYAAA